VKICVVGAGAIGGWMGVKLARAGHAVSVLARGATLAAIGQNGLQLVDGGETLRVDVTASADAADLDTPDLLIIAVKAPGLRDAALSVKPLIGPNTIVLTAMNGVPWWFFDRADRPLNGTRLATIDATGDVAASIPASIPARNVIGCVVHAACGVDAPGVIRHKMGQRLIVGEPSGGVSARLAALHEVLTAAGFESELSMDIQRDVWFKLWGNMTMNPVSALTGATTDKILDDPLVREFCSSVMREAQAIGHKIGIPIAQTPDERHAITRKLGAMKTSMLQDVEGNKGIELDALVAAVVEIGQKVGVATPCTNAMLGLTRLMARGRGLY
jgi:2-dehydropantoate 2-reductase